LSDWLYEAKFEVRDPGRLRRAVHDVLKVHALFPNETQPGAFRDYLDILKTEFEPFRGNL